MKTLKNKPYIAQKTEQRISRLLKKKKKGKKDLNWIPKSSGEYQAHIDRLAFRRLRRIVH